MIQPFHFGYKPKIVEGILKRCLCTFGPSGAIYTLFELMGDGENKRVQEIGGDDFEPQSSCPISMKICLCVSLASFFSFFLFFSFFFSFF